jgi:hypothetical protein
MKLITKTTLYLCKACDESPIFTTVMIFLAMVFFNMLEALVEKLIFGERFEHWLDPLFMGCFIAWAAYAVYLCAQLKIAKENGS